MFSFHIMQIYYISITYYAAIYELLFVILGEKKTRALFSYSDR